MQTRRPNLAHDIAITITQMIVDGQLTAGQRLNEITLAESLGVSRTPLREALTRLVAEGAVTAVPRVGFSVAALTVEEVEQIYPMRAILDPEALRMAGVPPQSTITALRAINARMQKAYEPADRIALDDEWHRLLLAHCPNRVILGLIEQFIARTRRYEMALMRDGHNVRISTSDHDRIMDALEAGNLSAACDVLRHNMQGGVAPIVAWLQSRETA